MKLTPLDIQQQQFRTSFWGFDVKEVDAFLDVLANDVEELIRENRSLRDDLRRRDVELHEHRERERTLKETMVTATRITEDIKQNARKEAEIVIAQAESQAEQIIQNAHTRLVRVMEDIEELRRQKAQFEIGLRSTIATHTKLLDALAEREGGAEVDASVAILARRGRRVAQDAGADDNEAKQTGVVNIREKTVRTELPEHDLLAPRGGDR
ncbi:MAG: DivIVA domain-containing protein [Deltaproteobacteria bacterium]|nr:DivIVA domain-containing protein [Deltaproteobacteria bacterium]